MSHENNTDPIERAKSTSALSDHSFPLSITPTESASFSIFDAYEFNFDSEDSYNSLVMSQTDLLNQTKSERRGSLPKKQTQSTIDYSKKAGSERLHKKTEYRMPKFDDDELSLWDFLREDVKNPSESETTAQTQSNTSSKKPEPSSGLRKRRKFPLLVFPAGESFDPKVLSRRQFAINELIETEKHHHNFMEDMKSYQEEMPFNQEQKDIIFSHVPSLIDLSANFITLFEEQRARGYDQAEIGRCFTDLDNRMLPFIPYIENYPESSLLLTRLLSGHRSFQEKEKELEKRGHHPLPSLLVMPVQRMMKYHLLLKEIQKGTPIWHPDYNMLSEAIDGLNTFSKRADDRISEARRKNALYNVSKSLRGCPKLTDCSYIGTYQMGPDREAILLTDRIMIAKYKVEGPAVFVKKKVKSLEKNILFADVTEINSKEEGVELQVCQRVDFKIQEKEKFFQDLSEAFKKHREQTRQ